MSFAGLRSLARREPARATIDLNSKAISTLEARCALLGVRLDIVDSDAGGHHFVATKWAVTKHLHSAAEVGALIARLGGAGA